MCAERHAEDSLPGAQSSSAPPQSVRINILSNIAGRGWAGIIGLLYVPIYILFLGAEAYGLFGVYLSMMAILAVLDLGLSSTLSRELARLTTEPGKEQEARDLLRTTELIYWSIGILIGAVVLLLAPFIAEDWLTVKGIPVETVRAAIMTMGGVIALAWPTALYSGGMIGIQRQVPFNAIQVVMATVQAVGAALILWLVSPSIILYFAWLIPTAMVQTLLLRTVLWRYMPKSAGADRARIDLLEKNRRFATGMTGITLLSTILMQFDKLLLSKFLTLEAFGYYMLACNVAAVLYNLIHPVYMGLFPKVSQAVYMRDEKEITSLYHKGAQLMSAILIPAAITLAFFSRESLVIWLKNETVASESFAFLSLLLCGTLLNGFIHLPYMLQLAHGWTKLSFYKNVIAVIVFVATLPWLILKFGAYGAAYAWIALNAGYLLIEPPIMHTRLLRSEMRRWYAIDVGLPLLVTFLVVLLSKTLFPSSSSLYVHIIWILSTFIFCFALTALSMPEPRKMAIRMLAELKCEK